MFNIFRLSKLKTLGEVGASSQHTLRTRPTPNADPDGIKPLKWIGGSQGPLSDVEGALPAKRRKNAVIAIECLLTASPEFFGDWKNPTPQSTQKMKEFFESGLERLKDIFGAGNVVSAYIHLDEKTPHLVAYAVPLKDGKLNARHFIGGSDGKEKLAIIQDLMHDAVQHLGLRRGVHKSKARHQDVKRFYGSMTDLEQEAIEAKKKASEELEMALKMREEVEEEKSYLLKVFDAITEQQKADLEKSVSKGMEHENKRRVAKRVPQ